LTKVARQDPAEVIEVVLALDPTQYAALGRDLETLRSTLDLPPLASNTEVVLEAVRKQADAR
jgi:hypothetical protein